MKPESFLSDFRASCLAFLPSFLWKFHFALPDTISSSSLVIACWRPLLYSSVSSAIRSSALSVAICMAIIRAACSAAVESSNAVNSRSDMTLGKSAATSSALPGSTMKSVEGAAIPDTAWPVSTGRNSSRTGSCFDA